MNLAGALMTLSQGLLVDVEHSVLGRLQLPGPPLRFFDDRQAEVTRQDHRPPPTEDGPRVGSR